MEPEVRIFLRKVAQTIFGGLLWLTINTALGIMLGLGFPDGAIDIWNIIFYIWFITSLGVLLYWYYKLWTNPDEKFDQ